MECVPNFSEGRRRDVVDAIVASIREVPGTKVLDIEMDPSHHRSVVTYIGDRASAGEAAFRAAKTAVERINMEEHRGEHPRIGALDVLPFVPIAGVTMEDCIELARAVGRRIADSLGIPVYLYEEAATRPDRRNLADIRKGEYEGLKEEIRTQPERRPDFGPAAMHATAGATVVGARPPLIAFNVNLATTDVAIAKKIARAVRARDGGLQYVKALGFELKDRGIVQVSMNMVNYRGTPLWQAFELIKSLADRYGVAIVGSEVVGLVPLDAIVDAADFYLKLENFKVGQILETRLWE